MNESEISRRSLLVRLFGGVALAAGALPVVAHASAAERVSPPAAGTTRYTFDKQGRLLGIAYGTEPAAFDGVAHRVLAVNGGQTNAQRSRATA